MKEIKDKKNNLSTVLLVVIIFCLVIGIILLYFKYENLEEMYDVLDDENNIEDNIEKYITKDEALNIVLEDLKISKSDLYDLDIELENKSRYDGVVFEVTFDYGNYEYEYYIHAVTGKILDSLKSID